jgi:alpha-glucosidase
LPTGKINPCRVSASERSRGRNVRTAPLRFAHRGTFVGAVLANTIVQISARDATAVGVSVNGSPLPAQPTSAAFNAADTGWYVTGGLIAAKSGTLDVSVRQQIVVHLVTP